MKIIWCMFPEIRSTTDNIFVFLDLFLPFYVPKDPEIKILRKWKKDLKILLFYKCEPWMTVIWCMGPEIWSATDWIFCHFGPFFALLQTEKLTFWKNEKNTWICYHFTQVYHKWQSYDAWYFYLFYSFVSPM